MGQKPKTTKFPLSDYQRLNSREVKRKLAQMFYYGRPDIRGQARSEAGVNLWHRVAGP